MTHQLRILLLALLVSLLCNDSLAQPRQRASVTKEPFGQLPDGTAVDLFTLTNQFGMQALITNYGGIVVSLTAPDRYGKQGDVVLGYDTLAEYVKRNPMFGALVGRYAGRIANAQFTMNGVEYKLTRPGRGTTHIHGGAKGFDKQVWQARTFTRGNDAALELRYLSKDGEEGYPGNLTVTVTYTLTEKNELRLDYQATTDKDTILNLTNHSYFNLAGAGDVLRHQITLNADRFTVFGEGLIPTGEIRSVANTPLDLRKASDIGARIDEQDEQLKMGRGYDHFYVLNHKAGTLGLAAKITEPTSGRVMEVLTTEPGVVFYTANGFDGSLKGKSGQAYVKRGGFCLETQHYPDSPHHANFPTTVLRKGAAYRSTTVFKFSVMASEPGKTR
ncbi:MAG: galactose mutarotase [Acidobacteria bacterium]|nr:galactose mutarotase [Acidobacteriota bacterium]